MRYFPAVVQLAGVFCQSATPKLKASARNPLDFPASRKRQRAVAARVLWVRS